MFEDMNINMTHESPKINTYDEEEFSDALDGETYWQACAASLQLENDMLHQQIKLLCYKLIKMNNIKDNQDGSDYDSCEDVPCEDDFIKMMKEVKVNDDPFSKPPNDEEELAKKKYMEDIYGNRHEKIAGMEAAVQLSYDIKSSRDNTQPWPIVPINNN